MLETESRLRLMLREHLETLHLRVAARGLKRGDKSLLIIYGLASDGRSLAVLNAVIIFSREAKGDKE